MVEDPVNYKVMRVNAKGVVTIPARVRKQLGLVPGTEVEFVTREKSVYLRKVTRGKDDRNKPADKSDRKRQG
jgi:AbrB family looped-hinge helix DNA binding protein